MTKYKILFLFLILQSACKKEDKAVMPEQPDFIKTTLPSTFSIEGGNSFDLYVPEQPGITSYDWTVPAQLEITVGQGTSKITVKTPASGGSIPEASIRVVAKAGSGNSYPRVLYQTISILQPPPGLADYKTKRYGSKTWMIEDLRNAGTDGNLGRVLSNPLYGRLYTWHEAMTGIAGCTPEQNPYKWGSQGTDDAGNAYTLDGTPARSFNIQIQGACPKGWHVPNVYDWYDLVVAVKSEYNVPAATLSDVASKMEGYIVGWDRDNGFTTGITLTNWGLVGPYLKGSRPVAEGGLWQGGTTFSYTGNAIFPNAQYPLYMSESANVGFNILPSGRWNDALATYQDDGRYSYHWTAWLKDSNNHFPLRLTVASGNANFSNGEESGMNALCVRCVANY